MIYSAVQTLMPLTTMLKHFDLMLSHYGVERGVRIARKHIGWYTQGFVHITSYHDRLFRSDDPFKIQDCLRCLFDAELDVVKPRAVFS